MADIIKLLPDSVANQIAAGEVIQRPASVVKELVENAVDAGSTNISIFIKDAGRTSIQVIDNGCGMSATDARLAFERHATSKINDAKDLFAIRTLGFRGEALASIAAIAEVKLRSKRMEDELGTEIDIAASQVVLQEPVNCPDGTSFLVRNLFYNTPARRKFLKANTTELKHIITEFQRVALTHPAVGFSLHHNNVEIYNLPQSNFRQRICNVFGKSINQFLVPINADTSIVKISGFIGKPESAKKSAGEQFFFVNHRYIRHPFLHRSVMKAYEQLLPSDYIPMYYIYFEVDPESIDINIHPTKTEVKFEDEQSIFQILLASLKEALGKFNIVPTLDFSIDTSIEIPHLRKDEDIRMPSIDINPDYNPFNEDNHSNSHSYRPTHNNDTLPHWEKLYAGLERDMVVQGNTDGEQQLLYSNTETAQAEPVVNTFQLKNKYILTSVKSGLMMIDQKRAHERILFERYMGMIYEQRGLVQRSLFPETIEFSAPEIACLTEILEDLQSVGFDMEFINDCKVQVNGYPADVSSVSSTALLQNIVSACLADQTDIASDKKERMAREMAQAAAIPYGKTLSYEEMKELVDHLFACETPNFSPSGKSIISILGIDEIEKRF